MLRQGEGRRGMGVEENPRHSQQGWRVRNATVKASSKGKVQHIAKIFLARILKSLHRSTEAFVFFKEISVRSSSPVVSCIFFLLK